MRPPERGKIGVHRFWASLIVAGVIALIAAPIWWASRTRPQSTIRQAPESSPVLRHDTARRAALPSGEVHSLGRLSLAVERVSNSFTEDLNHVTFTVTPKDRGPEHALIVPLNVDFNDDSVVDPIRQSMVDDIMTLSCGQHAVRVEAYTVTNGRPHQASFVVEVPPFYYSVFVSELFRFPDKNYSPVAVRFNKPHRIQRFFVFEDAEKNIALGDALKSIRCNTQWHNIVIGEVPMVATCELPEGDYNISALWFGQLMGEATAFVRAGQETLVRMTSRHSTTLVGQTLLGHRQSVPARVAVWKKPGQVDGEMWSLEAEVIAGKEGRFVIEGLSAGPKRVTASLDSKWLASSLGVAPDVLQSSLGLSPNTQYAEEFDLDVPAPKSHRRQFSIRGMPLESGETRDLGVIELGGPIDLCLTVVDETGQPVPDAAITVDLTEFMTVLKEGRTDDDGRFGVSGLAANEPIDVTVTKEPFTQHRVRLVPEGTVHRAHDGSNVYGTEPEIDASGKVVCNTDGSVLTRRASFARRLFTNQKIQLEFFEGLRIDRRIVLSPEPVKRTAEVFLADVAGNSMEFFYLKKCGDAWLETGQSVDNRPIILEAEGEYKILVSRRREGRRSFHYGAIDFNVDSAKWTTTAALETVSDILVRLDLKPNFADAFEIEGRVTFDGAALADAQIVLVAGTDRRIYPGTLGVRTVTGRDGEFLIAIPAEGPVALQIDKGSFFRRVALDDLNRTPGGRSIRTISLSR